MAPSFDPKRAMLRGPDLFKRLPLGQPEPVADLNLDHGAELVVFDRGDARYGLQLRQLAYHHVAQGLVNGQATLIAFCGICHSGMGFSPLAEGRELHFSAGGLYDGIVLLTDDETGSYWNHITGRAVYGPSLGVQLDPFPLDITTVGCELERNGNCQIFEGKPSLFGRFMGHQLRHGLSRKGFMPFFFKRTMLPIDPRADKMSQGLGVVIDDASRFYPVSELNSPVHDRLGGIDIEVRRRTEDHVPEAFDEQGERPMQLFCRWYGFSATYPDCGLYASRTETN
jgi:hypothetical protein